ncbi:hypothetical protein C1X19_27345, partial [Pseudomonas sp. GW460-4]
PLPHFDRVPAIQSGRLQGRRALAFDVGSPRQTRWPNAGEAPSVGAKAFCLLLAGPASGLSKSEPL